MREPERAQLQSHQPKAGTGTIGKTVGETCVGVPALRIGGGDLSFHRLGAMVVIMRWARGTRGAGWANPPNAAVP